MLAALATVAVGCETNGLNQQQSPVNLAQAMKYDAPAMAQSTPTTAASTTPTPATTATTTPTPTPSLSASPVVKPARLSARGNGFYQISGQPDGTINEASVVIQSGQDAQLKFHFAEGYDLAYAGKVEQMDAANVRINLVSPDYANIVGIAQVNFNPDNSINTIVMNGTSNLVPFQIQFQRGVVAQAPSPTPVPSAVPSPSPLPIAPAPAPINALW